MKMDNLRTMTVTSHDGKDVRDTNMLKGEAKPSAAFKEKNQTTQHSCAAPPTDGLGGMNRGK